jgi:hypothetical protein
MVKGVLFEVNGDIIPISGKNKIDVGFLTL